MENRLEATPGWRSETLTIDTYPWTYDSGVSLYQDFILKPPAIAGGIAPAYPLGDIAPGGYAVARVAMIRSFEGPHFSGAFHALTPGFPSWLPDGASVLFVPEPATLSLLAVGAMALVRRRRN